MRRVLIVFFVALFSLISFQLYPIRTTLFPTVYADELDDIQKQIADLTRSLEMSKAATKPLESQLSSLQKKIADIQARVSQIEKDITLKRQQIDRGYVDLAEQEKQFNQAVRDYYIKSYYNFPFLVLFSQTSASDVTRLLMYQKKTADEDKRIITNLVITVADLETKKVVLEGEEVRLAKIKEELSVQSAFLDKEVKGAKAYQSTISSQIAVLNAQQQQLLSQRLGSLNIPRSAGTGATACVDDRQKDPGFSQAIAFFTYGVPNRTGLNQYGADGRGKAGQNYEQILNAYYKDFNLQGGFENITIQVEGHGAFNIEDYVKRIYEMPNSFHPEALKAQAIAARSYALAYTNSGQGGAICTTQSCQVFQPGEKGGAWGDAVNATRGQVMAQGGAPVKAWYSSTHGGYILSTSELPGWSGTSWTKHATDTTSGGASGFSDLQSNAYDKESPWFYCDWGSRANYNKTAWMKSSEVADIVNIILLARADSGAKDHLYQTDKAHPYGGEVWNEERVKSELKAKNITPYSSISDVSVSADFGGGKTNSVNVSGDGGSQSFSGSEFKDWFNLRAPANIQIVGPLYNVERR